jgi:hypothetical protein
MIREVVSLDMLVILGVVTAYVGGGTKEEPKACTVGLGAPQISE